jgi:hypothetical protein
MKITLNFSQFLENWPASRKDQFSYEALEVIFNYIEEYEESAGSETEFDPIAICCEWSEYESALDAANDYTKVEQFTGTLEEQEVAARAWLEDRTTVLDAGDKIVMIQF